MQVSGNIFAMYNMGTSDYFIGDISTKLNDGNYHVIRFKRAGANSTLQVDDLIIQKKKLRGELRF